jgi:thiamine biosynthesis lipoprotein
VQTVSVIAATGARAEALTKPGFLRDPAEYLTWLPTVGAAGLIIDDEGAMLASGNWNRYL